MDQLEELLRDTLHDAAGSAPPPRGLVDGEAPRSRRRGVLLVAGVAAAVATIAIAVPVVIHGQGDPQAPATTQPTPGRKTEPPGSPSPIGPGIYLSPDRRTLYTEVYESVARRGGDCWGFFDATARFEAHGVAVVSLTEHVVVRGVHGCLDPAVGGPWYSRVPLSQPYRQPYVIDGRTGERDRILGTVDPTPDQIVNWP